MSLSIIEQGKKFLVAENGKAIKLPRAEGSTVITEFDTREDAEKYMKILSHLRKQKRYSKG